MSAEPSLADVQRDNPDLECWHGVPGLFYARRPGTGAPAVAEGEDPLDLSDSITRWRAREAWDAARRSEAHGVASFTGPLRMVTVCWLARPWPMCPADHSQPGGRTATP